MQNKTATEWLEEARANGETWVVQALENIAAQPNHPGCKKDYPFLSSVVIFHFAWTKTAAAQGFDYWWGIYWSIVKAENQNK